MSWPGSEPSTLESDILTTRPPSHLVYELVCTWSDHNPNSSISIGRGSVTCRVHRRCGTRCQNVDVDLLIVFLFLAVFSKHSFSKSTSVFSTLEALVLMRYINWRFKLHYNSVTLLLCRVNRLVINITQQLTWPLQIHFDSKTQNNYCTQINYKKNIRIFTCNNSEQRNEHTARTQINSQLSYKQLKQV